MIVERFPPAARKRLITIGDDAPLIAAGGLLRDLDADLVVVQDHDGILAGVITKTDIVHQISHCQGASCMTAASAAMTKAVASCRPGDLLGDVWSLMKERHLKNIPVLDQDSQRDIRRRFRINMLHMKYVIPCTCTPQEKTCSKIVR